MNVLRDLFSGKLSEPPEGSEILADELVDFLCSIASESFVAHFNIRGVNLFPSEREVMVSYNRKIALWPRMVMTVGMTFGHGAARRVEIRLAHGHLHYQLKNVSPM